MPPIPLVNAITVDLEDWVQSVYDQTLPLTNLFIRNTHRVLDLLDSCNTRATFFVLGLAAEKAPHLVRELVARGHEVQSHGFGHIPAYRQTPSEFATDISRSKKQLENLTGHEVTAYRAPMFSIVQSNLWALDALAEAGFTCDSSVFPVSLRRYGIAGTPLSPYYVHTRAGRLLEAPVAVIQHGPFRFPAGGGGYFRLCPYSLIRHCVRRLNAQGLPATIYLHPYELAPEEFDELPIRVPFRLRMHQGLGRGTMIRKLTRLLHESPFGPLSYSLSQRSVWPTATLQAQATVSHRHAAAAHSVSRAPVTSSHA
jgi:polysaccharide deacetylase family protein (PEP-CTERM system associated)